MFLHVLDLINKLIKKYSVCFTEKVLQRTSKHKKKRKYETIKLMYSPVF